MTVYVDSSVVLRVVLGQANRLQQWERIERAVASALLEVECFRTLDRLRLRKGLTDDALAHRRAATYRILEAIAQVEISSAVLMRAAAPLPTVLGTLDAIHLATALAWREEEGEITFATHDAALATAATACGFSVLGAA